MPVTRQRVVEVLPAAGAATVFPRATPDLEVLRAAATDAERHLPTAQALYLSAVPGADALARAAIGRGLAVVLATPDAVADLRALEQLAAAREVPLLCAGLGAGSLAVASLMSRVAEEQLGPLERVVVRAPGGKRTSPATSRRTPFDAAQQVSWALNAEQLTRLTALAAPAFRLADALVPGAAQALAPFELVAAPKARLACAALLHDVAVHVEVDEEMSGEYPWELEAQCARGAFVVQLGGENGEPLFTRGVTLPELRTEDRPAAELLVRHALRHRRAGARFYGAAQADAAFAACRAALEGAERRRSARPVDLVLVHVPRYRNQFDELRLPSLALARLTAFMRGYGFETRVVDLAADFEALPLDCFTDDARIARWLEGADDPEVAQKLEAMWPSLAEAVGPRSFVGFSIVDYFGHFQLNLASALAREVKRRTGRPVVLGGERDQVDGERGMGPSMPFDFVVEGDGELALLELAHLVAYGDRRPTSIAGVASRKGDGTLQRNKVVRSHLNAMPRPDFGGMPLEHYLGRPTPELLAALARDGLAPASPPAPFMYLPYAFVKGCPAKCTFCSAKESLDMESPEKAASELLELSARHGVKDFVFLNNLVNTQVKWLEKFCRTLIDSKADLQWTDSCRPTGLTSELTAMMRESGCLLLCYGAESGSDDVLTRMKKGLLSRDIVSSLRNAHQAGIINRVNLIAGYFHETAADVDKTIGLVETLEDEIDVIGCFQGFYLFPGMGVEAASEQIVLRSEPDRLKGGQLTLAYDEIGGLKWEEKRDTIDRSRTRILDRIEQLGIRTLDKVNEYDLFWLSRRFRDKATVVKYLLAPPESFRTLPNQRPLPPAGVRGQVPPP
ncbi:MAG: radical SAM protein [Archangiaceae bacterium]|nr:radical SAM protein [Archangiaceae bacterium]